MASGIFDRFGNEIEVGDIILYALGCGRSSGCFGLYRVVKAETYEEEVTDWNKSKWNADRSRYDYVNKIVTKERLSARDIDQVGTYTRSDEPNVAGSWGAPYTPRKAVALRDSKSAIVVTGKDLGPLYAEELTRFERANAEAGYDAVGKPLKA